MGHVSSLSIAGMAFSALVSLALPVAAFLFWKKHSSGQGRVLFLGAVTFVLFAILLEQMLHSFVFSRTGDRITGSLWAYAVYGGLCAGIFEETGRWLAMKIYMKNCLDRDNAVMLGIGHGGIEAVILIGVSMISNLATAVMINTESMESALAALEESVRTETVTQLSALWTTEPYLFFMGGMERISAFFLQIALSCLVFRAVRDRRIMWFVLAVGIHFLIDAGSILLGSVVSVPVLELLLLAAVGLVWLLLIRSMKREDTAGIAAG